MPESQTSKYKDIERELFESFVESGGILPTSCDEIEHAEREFAEEPIQLPERLRDPGKLLEKIKRTSAGSQAPHVFGQLIHMLRINHKLSPRDLAEKTRIDLDELCRIESDSEYRPKPRTVSVLAKYFQIVPQNLSRVANLTRRSNDKVFDGAVKFAASSNQQFEQLSREQKRALKAFLKILNKS